MNAVIDNLLQRIIHEKILSKSIYYKVTQSTGMTIFGQAKPNLDSVLQLLLKHLKVKVMPQTASICLSNHPDYPSMLSIGDCLTEWNIPNQSFQLKKEDYDVNNFLFPFLAHLPEQGGRFILISEINNGMVRFSDEKQNATMTESDFLARWDGFVLFSENDNDCGEKNYKQNFIKYSIQSLVLPFGIILVVAIMATILANQVFSWPNLLLSLLKFGGLCISILLLIQSIHSNNIFIQNLCGLAGKNDCNAILKSDAAKVTSWLSWSEVGFFYFAGTSLALLLYPSSLLIIFCLTICALPYTVYSISYQYRTKNWCVLCCMVQAILLSEALVFGFWPLNFSSRSSVFSLSSFGFLALVFLLPILTWSFLKPFFLQAAQQKPLQQQLKKFKYNSDLFNQVLKNQPHYSVGDELMPIVLGNPKAETVITMVSNPFCGPCAKAHQTVDQWLKTRDDLQLKLIFTTANHDDDDRTKVAQHATALSLLTDKKVVENALNDWYALTNKNYEDWAAKYPLNYNGEVRKAGEQQKKWCEMAEIAFTPTILVNGYKLPEPYSLEDIKYLLT